VKVEIFDRDGIADVTLAIAREDFRQILDANFHAVRSPLFLLSLLFRRRPVIARRIVDFQGIGLLLADGILDSGHQEFDVIAGVNHQDDGESHNEGIKRIVHDQGILKQNRPANQGQDFDAPRQEIEISRQRICLK
jgi:hypothetical protein